MTLRVPDGTEYRMERWTNPTPFYITNVNLLHDDMDHVKTWSQPWLDMKDDYERNKDTGKFENNMTSVYFPGGILSPSEYGIIVVDMVNKIIIDAQDYTRFGKITTMEVYLFAHQDELEDVERLKAFIDEGRVIEFKETSLDSHVREDISPILYDPSMASSEIIQAVISGAMDGKFIVDMSPYVIERFDSRTRDGIEAAMRRIENLGFVLTDEEKNAWNEAINEHSR